MVAYANITTINYRGDPLEAVSAWNPKAQQNEMYYCIHHVIKILGIQKNLWSEDITSYIPDEHILVSRPEEKGFRFFASEVGVFQLLLMGTCDSEKINSFRNFIKYQASNLYRLN